MTFDRDAAPGVLATGVRPGVTGWYWCQRAGYQAPECVYIVAPQINYARIMTISTGDTLFAGTPYDRDDTRWYGPFSPPPICTTWDAQAAPKEQA